MAVKIFSPVGSAFVNCVNACKMMRMKILATLWRLIRRYFIFTVSFCFCFYFCFCVPNFFEKDEKNREICSSVYVELKKKCLWFQRYDQFGMRFSSCELCQFFVQVIVRFVNVKSKKMKIDWQKVFNRFKLLLFCFCRKKKKQPSRFIHS